MGAGALLASHDDLQPFFGGGERQFTHSEVVEDEQGTVTRNSMLFAGAVESGFDQLIEQGVGFAVENAIPLLDSGVADGLSQVALAGAAERRSSVGQEKIHRSSAAQSLPG